MSDKEGKKNKLEEKSAIEKAEPEAETKVETKTEKPVAKVKDFKCDRCKFSHTDTFDGPGIGHWPFAKGSSAENQYYFYCSEPKTSIYIPLDPGEKITQKSIPLATPQVNGLKVGIVKGHYVQVPQSLAEIVMDSLNQTSLITANAKTAPNPYTGERNPARLDLRDETTKGRLDV